MAVEVVPRPDRRRRRRQETIEEVLDVALAIMAEQGVAGLSVGEIARRMGIRPPSLYGYFPSKHALYDALFERGARAILDTMSTLDIRPDDGRGVEELLLESAETFVRWTIDNPAYTQLLFWRPVPGFEPSPRAYEPAVQLLEFGRAQFEELQRRGLLRDDVSVDQIRRDWTALISGVFSQQLANAPHQSYEEGRFTRALQTLVPMFARYYGGTPRADQR
jgi:AcrR family transcriptional regulator